ncbi:MAG: hypothetical protein HZA46_02235 [Planctomycetales bacterium]|nr:hypothetical protein [Planctomycetales bacterium]
MPLQTIPRHIAHPVVSGSRVRRSDEMAKVGEPHALSAGQPIIELVKESEVVKAIDVTCSCGQKFRLWCDYESE